MISHGDQSVTAREDGRMLVLDLHVAYYMVYITFVTHRYLHHGVLYIYTYAISIMVFFIYYHYVLSIYLAFYLSI